MCKCRFFRLLAALLAVCVLALSLAVPAMAEGTAFNPVPDAATAETDSTEAPDSEAGAEGEADPPPADSDSLSPAGEATVYVGEIATRVETRWECATSFPVKSSSAKTYATMVGNVLQLTVYSTVPMDSESNFYVPMDSHISYVDGTDRFTMTGQSGEYYCYEKALRVTTGGTFALTVANINTTLYNGLYDTITITAYDTIDSLDFFVEQGANSVDVYEFFVTANGSATALITPDTLGFNASDNEWKIVTAEKTEKVLFEGTTYQGFAFSPGTITLSIKAGEEADQANTAIQIYYLGLINGKLFTVGPYTFPASANTYSSTFELAQSRMDVLATEGTATFYGYVQAGRTPDITVSEVNGVTELSEVTKVESDREEMDKYAITILIGDTSQDLDLLVGNRWSTNQIAYNYRTLHISFLRNITSLALTGQTDGHYHVNYAVTVNGQQDLITTAVNWYINGKLQPEHGMTLERFYNQGGHYTIHAELGGLTSNTVENNIIYAAWQAILWYCLAAAVVVLAAVAALHGSRVRGARLDVRLRTQMQAMLEELENTQVRLLHGKISARVALRNILRMERRFTALQDALLLRYRATNVATYQQAAEALQKAQSVTRAGGHRKEDSYYTRAVCSTCQHALHKSLEYLQEISALAIR